MNWKTFTSRVLSGALILLLVSCNLPSAVDSSQSAAKSTQQALQQFAPTQDQPATLATSAVPAAEITPVESGGGDLTFVISRLWFTVAPGNPVAMPAFMHPEMGCDWMGVGGQAFDIEGQPVQDLLVLLQGNLADAPVTAFATTGTATALGPGGFEFTLAQTPITSTQSLYLTLYDNLGNQLSDAVYFDTVQNCDTNFVLVNFHQVLISGRPIFMPMMFQLYDAP